MRRFYASKYLRQDSAGNTSGILGYYCRTYKDKMFTVEGVYLASSCVGKPDVWKNIPETEPPTNVKTAGYFANDLSVQDSDMTYNVAIEVYYDKLAIMGKNATQLWKLDPDPTKDQYTSTLRGTGTIAWRSVLQYGSGDVLFLANDGVRSLRARDSSLAASVSDVGSPIDPLIQDLHRQWGEYSMSQAISIVQPITGRVWVIIPLARDEATGVVSSRIFVLSAFPGPKISAWSEYRPNFNAVAACTHLNRIVLRDDQHRVWVYGNMADTVDPNLLYDASPVEVVFPFSRRRQRRACDQEGLHRHRCLVRRRLGGLCVLRTEHQLAGWRCRGPHRHAHGRQLRARPLPDGRLQHASVAAAALGQDQSLHARHHRQENAEQSLDPLQAGRKLVMFVDTPTERDLRFVLENLRELDKRELLATGCVLEQLPQIILANNVFCFCAVDASMMPHAVWGLMAQRKGVGTGFAFGTKHWGRALPVMMKNIKRWVLPFLLQKGYHRVECVALAHRKDVERFLEMIGAYPEATLRQWGSGGEDFVSYRWLADEHRAEKCDGRRATRLTLKYGWRRPTTCSSSRTSLACSLRKANGRIF